MENSYLESLEKRLKLFRSRRSLRVIQEPLRCSYYYLTTRLLRRLHKSLKVTTKTFWGDTMIVVIPECVSCEIFLNGYIEEGLTRMILENLKSGMTFFDIGAHFGYYTLLGSTIVGESGRVHSFEPTLSTYKILLDNVNGRNNIVVNNVALFSRNTTILFYDYGNEYAAFNSFTRPRLDHHIIKGMASTKVEIKAVSVDEYAYNKSIKPDFIKIDAESAEYEILKGMAKTIADFRPIISLEVGDMNIPNVKSSQEIILHLIQNGYEAYEYKNGNIVKHNLIERYGYDNILFLPK